jgi:transcriptional regulator with XRE-family HTH domain
MNISKTIREQRSKLSLSQEELAAKLYVTRQTIGNWENDKSYPDIHSLILLSQIFDMTIDSLIKGDLEIMEQKIEKSDIKTMNLYGWLMAVGMVITVILLPVSGAYRFIPGIVIAILVWIVTMYFALKVEKIKKQYDVQSYREIIAFTKGETLDEIAKIRESGKRKYQKILIVAAATIFALVIATGVLFILKAL